MPSNAEIIPSQLARLIGLPTAPAIMDIRTAEDVGANPRFLPGAQRHDALDVGNGANEYADRNVVVVCQKGRKLSQGVTA